MDINIPGVGSFHLQNVIFDLNGTLAVDGKISEDIRQRIKKLSRQYRVVIASSDIHNNLETLAKELGVEAHILKSGEIAPQKAELMRQMGADITIAVGNGSNDWQMLREAALGIVVIGKEGASTKALLNADVIVPGIEEAIDCILTPLRLIATLRY